MRDWSEGFKRTEAWEPWLQLYFWFWLLKFLSFKWKTPKNFHPPRNLLGWSFLHFFHSKLLFTQEIWKWPWIYRNIKEAYKSNMSDKEIRRKILNIFFYLHIQLREPICNCNPHSWRSVAPGLFLSIRSLRIPIAATMFFSRVDKTDLERTSEPKTTLSCDYCDNVILTGCKYYKNIYFLNFLWPTPESDSYQYVEHQTTWLTQSTLLLSYLQSQLYVKFCHFILRCKKNGTSEPFLSSC